MQQAQRNFRESVVEGEVCYCPQVVEEPVRESFRPASDLQLHGEPDIQTQFVQQNLRRIFLLIYRIVGNVDDAQDLTQETFIKALQRQGQLKDLEKAASWLSRIAANTAIDFLRRNKKFVFSDIHDLMETRPSGLEDPEQVLLRGERKLQLDGGLAELTARERTALLLRDVEDMPADQVAAQMNCSMATVRSHIANARIKFKRYLDGRKRS
ncbi:MAG: RNA polymerase sigma factor [Acidobacteriaceae bacterium]|nr:RNA polymerase sigma factor [Acidobacteriaceae bacterium]MBV9037762.1 RNA polymerase sigma factor [Acidobacteriaceae bacterium]MBV9225479.1 RNA polymerase sigma factor [Acidobacteriaceae bacterium]MBV9304967.1 RNA polymerase sigma factor [Acidobacteriaceae bacterium]MBV9679642.1 RNA polymerase sigma factor [Acidobacteriaceae bacterium]